MLRTAFSSAIQQGLVPRVGDDSTLQTPSSSAQYKELIPQSGDDSTLQTAPCSVQQAQAPILQTIKTNGAYSSYIKSLSLHRAFISRGSSPAANSEHGSTAGQNSFVLKLFGADSPRIWTLFPLIQLTFLGIAPGPLNDSIICSSIQAVNKHFAGLHPLKPAVPRLTYRHKIARFKGYCQCCLSFPRLALGVEWWYVFRDLSSAFTLYF